MKERNDGGPAFPTEANEIAKAQAMGFGWPAPVSRGMSLRDYFAAAALQGILASNYDPHGGEESASSDNKACALHAYEIADAMIAEREKEENK